jgi:hypothetical protein
MGALASLAAPLISVEPGSEASVEIKVKNSGSVVDQMTISVVGDASEWSRAEPPELSLFPGAEGTATVIFAPPRRSTISAGELPFGVRVASQEDPDGSVVEEGRLEIAPFADVGAELQPLTTRGARGARHDLAVDNRGNVPLNAEISGFDSNEDVAFDIKPPAVVAGPGEATFAQVDVKPRKRFWRGRPKARAFTVQVEAPEQPPVPVNGTYLQEPVVPGWLIKGLIALAAIAILLLLIWFLFLQPTLLSTAEERAEEVAAEVAEPVAREAAEQALEDAGVSPGGGGGDASPSPSPSPSPVPTATPTPAPTPEPTSAGLPRHARLPANSQIKLPADGQALHLTDLVFSNPVAQEGELTLRRNEDDVLLVLRLENFRDLDFHFVTPIVIEPGDTLSLRCTQGSCEGAAMLYSGLER